MRPRTLAILATLIALPLGGCGSGTPSLMNLRSDTKGPDEFGILPTKPLEMPTDLAALPAPTPGGANLVDPNPAGDAIAALGGAQHRSGGVPGGDGAIVTYAARNGVAADIRTTLATEDLDFRRRNNGLLLERLFKTTVYFKAYRRQSLDQQAELARWRSAGAATPSAPPAQ